MSTLDDRCPVSGPSGVIYTPDRTGQIHGTLTDKPDRRDKNRAKTGQPESLPSPLRSIRFIAWIFAGIFAGSEALPRFGLHPSPVPIRPQVRGHRSFSPLADY
jgi:hypothetical protein